MNNAAYFTRFADLCLFQAVMEGRAGFGLGVQAAVGGAVSVSRAVLEPSNGAKQPALSYTDPKSAFSTKGMQKIKQHPVFQQPPLQQQQQQQQRPAASVPPVNFLFGSDGCLRSHIIQEVLRVVLLPAFARFCDVWRDSVCR